MKQEMLKSLLFSSHTYVIQEYKTKIDSFRIWREISFIFCFRILAFPNLVPVVVLGFKPTTLKLIKSWERIIYSY